MNSPKDILKNLLQNSTVKLAVPGVTTGWGTGFFITHDLVLTCAHVVKGEGSPVNVCWQPQAELVKASVEKSVPDADLALLRLFEPIDEATCVYLDLYQNEIPETERAYLFGYPDKDYPDGCPVLVTCEGFLGGEFPLIKFKSGQVRPGMSGSPILNLTTGKVFGMVKDTRDRSSDLGGDGVSAAIIFQHFPELIALQKLAEQKPSLWRATLKLPIYVQDVKNLIFRSYARSGCIDEVCNSYLLNLRSEHGLSKSETNKVEKDLFELCKCLNNKVDNILPTFEQEIFNFFQSVTDLEAALPKLKSKLKDLGMSLRLNETNIEEVSNFSLCQYISKELLSFNSEKAIFLYKEAIKENPNFENFYICLGVALSEERKFKEAIDVFSKAERIIRWKEHFSVKDLNSVRSLIRKTKKNREKHFLRKISPLVNLVIVVIIVFFIIKAAFFIKIVFATTLLLIIESLTKILQFLASRLGRE